MALSDSQLSGLRARVVRALSATTYPQVLKGETEPAYTGRVIMPVIGRLIRELNHDGLKLRGDGEERPDYVTLGHLKFTPDVAISHNHTREIAVECKFISSWSVNNSISTAMGQAVLYQNLGYRLSMVILIEKGPGRVLDRMTTDSLAELQADLDFDVIVALAGSESEALKEKN